MPRLSPAVLALSLIGAMAATSAVANPRAFVASYGSDANTASACPVANPCRTLAAAHSVVDPGGIILAQDGAGYGIVTITKSVTITANPGFYAGMGNSTGSVITIATPGVVVTLRGLNIDGSGASHGINMTNGAKLSIENCVISNFTSAGVNVTTAASVRIVDSLIRDNNTGVLLQGGSTATISGTKFLGNTNSGVAVIGDPAGTTTTAAVSDTIVTGLGDGVFAYAPTATATALMSVTRSTISNNQYGVVADFSEGTTVVTLSNSMVTGNSISGLYQLSAGSTLESLGNNTVRQNGANTSGTITLVSPI